MDREIVHTFLKREVTLVLTNGFNYDGTILSVDKSLCSFRGARDGKIHTILLIHIIDIIERQSSPEKQEVKEKPKMKFEFPAKKETSEKMNKWGHNLERFNEELSKGLGF